MAFFIGIIISDSFLDFFLGIRVSECFLDFLLEIRISKCFLDFFMGIRISECFFSTSLMGIGISERFLSKFLWKSEIQNFLPSRGVLIRSRSGLYRIESNSERKV